MNKKEIKYKVSLEHDDFVLLLDILRKAQESRLINWDGTGFICQHTQVERITMKRKLLIKGAGMLYSEIILTALQEYRRLCKQTGNHSRAGVVDDIINAIDFEPAEI